MQSYLIQRNNKTAVKLYSCVCVWGGGVRTCMRACVSVHARVCVPWRSVRVYICMFEAFFLKQYTTYVASHFGSCDITYDRMIRRSIHPCMCKYGTQKCGRRHLYLPGDNCRHDGTGMLCNRQNLIRKQNNIVQLYMKYVYILLPKRKHVILGLLLYVPYTKCPHDTIR